MEHSENVYAIHNDVTEIDELVDYILGLTDEETEKIFDRLSSANEERVSDNDCFEREH